MGLNQSEKTAKRILKHEKTHKQANKFNVSSYYNFSHFNAVIYFLLLHVNLVPH